jgi:hypothetical protein
MAESLDKVLDVECEIKIKTQVDVYQVFKDPFYVKGWPHSFDESRVWSLKDVPEELRHPKLVELVSELSKINIKPWWIDIIKWHDGYYPVNSPKVEKLKQREPDRMFYLVNVTPSSLVKYCKEHNIERLDYGAKGGTPEVPGRIGIIEIHKEGSERVRLIAQSFC